MFCYVKWVFPLFVLLGEFSKLFDTITSFNWVMYSPTHTSTQKILSGKGYHRTRSLYLALWRDINRTRDTEATQKMVCHQKEKWSNDLQVAWHFVCSIQIRISIEGNALLKVREMGKPDLSHWKWTAGSFWHYLRHFLIFRRLQTFKINAVNGHKEPPSENCERTVAPTVWCVSSFIARAFKRLDFRQTPM